MTTHRERIEACLRGEIIDRPPVALWRHYPVDDQSAKTLAAAHAMFQRIYDFDLVKVTPASSFSVKDWGVDDVWEGNTEGTRRYSRYVIEKASDWERLEVLSPEAPHLAEQLDCVRAIRKELGPDTPILQTVFSPLAQAKHLAGDRLLLAHLRQFPDAVELGLKTITESTRKFIGAAAKTGIDGIFYAVQHAQAGLLSRDEFARFSRAADTQLLQEAGNLWCNMLHVHGERVYLDLCADYPAQILNWHDRESGPSLVEARANWRGAVCGGIGRTTLVYQPASAVTEEADEAMALTGGKGFLLSTGCVAPIITPLGSLDAARRAVEQWPGTPSGSK
jgi:uroporphyrinogen decarboxylase